MARYVEVFVEVECFESLGSVCVCVFVFVSERKIEKERDRESEKEMYGCNEHSRTCYSSTSMTTNLTINPRIICCGNAITLPQ